MKNILRILPVLVIALQSPALTANSDSGEVEALSRQIAAQEQEIAELRGMVEMLMKLRPTVTMLMPDISERLHVMHYAGDAEDWALASHELQVIKGLVDKLQLIDPEKGALARGFLQNDFNQIEAAIEHGDMESFDKALDATVANCNACHIAVGSPTMKVVLDAEDSLSMRHSHALEKSKKPGDHMHTH